MTDDRDSTLTPQAVADYLSQHPDFFLEHRTLLQDLQLPHDSGKAVSLIEKQVAVLRERNVELRNRLGQLISNARDNDILFDKSRRLVLALLEANEVGDYIDALLYSLDNDFQVQHSSLVLFSDEPGASIGPAKVMTPEQAKQTLPRLAKLSKALCGQLAQADLSALFGSHPVTSAAVVPLVDQGNFGLLAVGNQDPNYYRSSVGTLFLSYIAEVINRTLPRLL